MMLLLRALKAMSQDPSLLELKLDQNTLFEWQKSSQGWFPIIQNFWNSGLKRQNLVQILRNRSDTT